jgi:integrase/recombinase XerC
MLTKHITGFIEYCKVSGFRERSLQAFAIRLQEFDKFFKTRRIRRITAIKYSHLLDFVAEYKNPSVHVKKSRVWALHQFFHYLTLQGLVDDNIALKLPYPKIEKTVPHFLTVDELNKILLYCSERSHCLTGLRNLIIMMMLGMLGLRTGTLIRLKVQDIDVKAGLAWIHEKGGGKRMMVLPKVICQVLKAYIRQRGLRPGPLFLSERGKQLSPRTLQDIFRKAANSVDIDKHLHAHLFRHTAATHLNRISDISVTQQVLGHRIMANTLKYAHLNPDTYATYMKKHPFMKGGC